MVSKIELQTSGAGGLKPHIDDRGTHYSEEMDWGHSLIESLNNIVCITSH